jgi:PAS domain S-box-containing protein
MAKSIKTKIEVEFHEARFEAIVQTASDVIVISDENSIIVFANKKTYEVFGYDEGTLIGSNLGVLMSERYRKGHKVGVRRFLDTGNPKLIGHTVEIEGLRKDGTVFPLELSLSAWKEEGRYFFSGIIRDVTERKQALAETEKTNKKLQEQQEELEAANEELQAALEELQIAEEQLREANEELEHRVEVRTRELTESERRVKQSEEELRLITDAMPVLISYIRSDGTFGVVNKAHEDLFQISREEIIGKSIKEVIGEKAYDNSFPFIEKALKGEYVESEILQDYGAKIGKMWRRAFFVPRREEGRVIGIFALVEDITVLKNIQLEQELANQKLREKDAFYQALIEHGSDIITLFDEELNYIYCGGSILKELGYKPEQLIGDNALNFIHPEDIPMIKEYWIKTLSSGEKEINVAEFRFKNAKGEWRWLEARGSNQLQNPSVRAVIFSSRDITERVKSKQELEKLSLVASKTTNGVLILDAEGRIEWLNEGLTKNTGYTFSEVVGKLPGSFLRGEDTDKANSKQLEEKLKQGKPFTGEVLWYRKDGEKLWVLLDFTPIFNEVGELTRYIVIVTDISERKQAEENQLQMTNDLFRHNKDLQQFNYIVSHNLRSPVSSIMGLADLLTTTEDKNSEVFNVSLGYLKKTADQLDTVLKDLNQILSIRNKKAASVNEKVELIPVCQQVIETLQEPLNECGGKVYLKIEEGISVNGNKAYLYSIFYNLLSNSIKYRSPDRSLEVNIKCYNNIDSGVVISFSDNGLGFDMEKVGENIFKLYKRFHNNFEGKGIGLYLVKTQVEAMDGQIEVNSRVNVGTTFLIYLK